jgi:amidase/aspartyl-tRNA(Asn)/glutamyl-tRNA(Gln) amidotransferase subunit A
VASGAAWAALGSDTGGSIRIPAALCGIVGFKSTARRVPAAGAFPLSTTLDTVSALTLSVRDAVLLHEVLAARTVVRGGGGLRDCRLAVPRQLMLDGMDSAVASAFERTLGRLSAAGARIETVDLPELAQAPQLQARCTFAGAEAAAWHRDWLQPHAHLYDPRVLLRLQKGATMLAPDYVALVAERQAWITRMERAIGHFDALLSPTVPTVAPPLSEVAPGAERDDAFFALNGLLLRNTTAINLLDGCALSLPCHQAGELPVGLMVWQGAWRDDGVLHASLLIEAALAAGGQA